jgi:mono/diheme cytochrome c family protein
MRSSLSAFFIDISTLLNVYNGAVTFSGGFLMKKVLIMILFLVSLAITACSRATSSDTIPADYAGKTNPFGTEAASAGAEVFKTNCASCHGNTGHGDGIAGKGLYPAPKNLAVLQSQVDDDYLFWRINTGKEGTVMVPWKGILTEDQIWQVISFLHTLKN